MRSKGVINLDDDMNRITQYGGVLGDDDGTGESGESKDINESEKAGLKFYCDTSRHLVCVPYNVENLHKMAAALGISRSWFHRNASYPHYDIPKRRIGEITSQCELVSARKILEIVRGQSKANESFLALRQLVLETVVSLEAARVKRLLKNFKKTGDLPENTTMDDVRSWRTILQGSGESERFQDLLSQASKWVMQQVVKDAENHSSLEKESLEEFHDLRARLPATRATFKYPTLMRGFQTDVVSGIEAIFMELEPYDMGIPGYMLRHQFAVRVAKERKDEIILALDESAQALNMFIEKWSSYRPMFESVRYAECDVAMFRDMIKAFKSL